MSSERKRNGSSTPRHGGPVDRTGGRGRIDVRDGAREEPNDEVTVRTRRWCSFVMIPVAALACLAQCSYAAMQYTAHPAGAMYAWMIAATLLALVLPFVLVLRDRHPEAVFWVSCAIVLVFPYDSMLALMAMTSPRARALLDSLPGREREAVLLAAEGFTNAQIAERMFISERTAKAHLSSAADKLAMGRVQMARLVERADLPARP
ncbi:helix-turn-helix transcriptional regulator [Bifidobacterium santillanense]|uniref:helix-turn-helix transcriptional regulator n=1 Tax=Bifidobacterium santillanense TaxID=2809028 RepID=UPI001F0ADC9B|nr:helix-turn-helix transcriptional regulator [Bifidobacterium santillanense]